MGIATPRFDSGFLGPIDHYAKGLTNFNLRQTCVAGAAMVLPTRRSCHDNHFAQIARRLEGKHPSHCCAMPDLAACVHAADIGERSATQNAERSVPHSLPRRRQPQTKSTLVVRFMRWSTYMHATGQKVNDLKPMRGGHCHSPSARIWLPPR